MDNFEMEMIIENALNFYNCAGEILNVNEVKEAHQKTRSIDFWNYIQSIGDGGFRMAIEKVVK